MLKAIVLDVETNGQEPQEVIEAYAVSVDDDLSSTLVLDGRYGTDSMTLRALSTHHITLDSLKGLQRFEATLVPQCEYLIGHNIDFDWEAIGKPHCKRICTLALSRHLWPELDCHTLTAVGYAKLALRGWQGVLRNMHSASSDVGVVLGLLPYIIEAAGVKGWENLWKLSEVARVPTIMPFGKHKGMPISDLPNDYVGWLNRQPDLDQYLVKALQARRK
jgi:exodeoxyribonuclease X